MKAQAPWESAGRHHPPSAEHVKPSTVMLRRVHEQVCNGRRATFYFVQRWPKHFQEDLKTVLSLLAEGKIGAHVAQRIPLEKASEALGLLASGKASGKVVLVPGLEGAER